MAEYENRDWFVDVRLGQIEGFQTRDVTGYKRNAGTEWQHVWQSPSTIDTGLIEEPNTVRISSQSSSDTLTGNGAQKVRVSGLNELGAEVGEIINMDGLNPVVTENQYSIVTHLTVIQAGSNGANVDKIWAGRGPAPTGNPATKYCLIRETQNISHLAAIATPANYNLWLGTLRFTSDDPSNKLEVAIAGYLPSTGIWYRGHYQKGRGGRDIVFWNDSLRMFEPGTIIIPEVKADTAGLYVSATLEYMLEEITT